MKSIMLSFWYKSTYIWNPVTIEHMCNVNYDISVYLKCTHSKFTHQAARANVRGHLYNLSTKFSSRETRFLKSSNYFLPTVSILPTLSRNNGGLLSKSFPCHYFLID